MASLMDSGPSPAADHSYAPSVPSDDPMSGMRSTGRPGPASGTTKAARGTSSANKPVKASKTKTPNGANSDHRKEQNRIASRNYREKRKHKLALLQQILHEPAASERPGASATTATAATPTRAPAPAESEFGTLTDGLADPLLDSLVDSLAGISPDFQPIMSGLIPANMLAPPTTAGSTTSTTAPLAASSVPTASQEEQPLDDFAAWAATNLPSVVAANSPRAKSTTSPSASTSRSTSTPVPALSSSSATTSEALLDMPMLQPWLIPFSSDQNIFAPFLSSTSLNNGAVTSSSFSSTPTTTTATATASATNGRSQTSSGPAVTETVDIDEAFDPAIDVNQFMSGTDGNQQGNSASNADNSFFSDLLMRPDFSTSFYATGSNHTLQGTFSSATPVAFVGSSIPLPFSSASPPSSHRQPTRPNTTTLPSRPSPRPFFQTLASPSDTTAASVPPQNLPYRYTSPTTAADMEREPSRRARKKNMPVVRAMLQYVQTLSPHQKRLILQALLDGEGGGEEGGDGDVENTGDDDDERIEEIDNVEDDSDGSNGGQSNKSRGSAGSASKATTKKTAFLSRREDRRRQVIARWNSGRFSNQAAGGDPGSSFSSSSSSPLSGASTMEATSFANMALNGFDGPNGLTGPIHHGQPPNGIYGANFGAEPGARPYFPVPLMVMNLQCRRMGFRAALLQNCLACGLANPDVMFDESACYDEALEPGSPFALNADEARAVVLQGVGRIAAVVAAVRQNLARSGKTPPRDLQPVDAQILVAHHPYIDIIPFRGFRARTLALLAEMEAAEEVAAAVASNNKADGTGMSPSSRGDEPPCLLDEDELCYDMNVAEGLVCWGSQMGNAGAGLSSQAKRDSESARDMRACLPWDMRSWEPQVWFLKKYWFLVGGWDDDMWRNCRWWHSMRGDDLDYSVYAEPGY